MGTRELYNAGILPGITVKHPMLQKTQIYTDKHLLGSCKYIGGIYFKIIFKYEKIGYWTQDS